jgi:predicted component of type VI protein secretion system
MSTTLGDCYLGYDAFAGAWCLSEVPELEIKVGPLQFHKVTDFLDDGKAARVIRLVMELLLPAETEYTVRPLLSQGNDELILNAHAHCAVLGYSSRI